MLRFLALAVMPWWQSCSREERGRWTSGSLETTGRRQLSPSTCSNGNPDTSSVGTALPLWPFCLAFIISRCMTASSHVFRHKGQCERASQVARQNDFLRFGVIACLSARLLHYLAFIRLMLLPILLFFSSFSKILLLSNSEGFLYMRQPPRCHYFSVLISVPVFQKHHSG